MSGEAPENPSTETTDSPKKTGKSPAPTLEMLTVAVGAFFATPVGAGLLAEAISHQLPTHVLTELPDTPSTPAPPLTIGQAARLFGIQPADILTCRHYPDDRRYVVVTTDGRKLDMNEADHAA